MTPGLRVEVEIDLAAGQPLIAQFGEQGGDQPQAGIGVGKGEGAYPQCPPGPEGGLGMFPTPGIQGQLRRPFRLGFVRSVEDHSKLLSYGLSGALKREELTGILRLMKLPTLPGSRRTDRSPGGFERRMIVGDDELDPLFETSAQEASWKRRS